MEMIWGLLMLLAGLITSGLFWSFKKDEFLEKESDRCLNKFCEVDNNWNSKGRVCTKGLALIEKNGKKQFVRQAKLCDIGILD